MRPPAPSHHGWCPGRTIPAASTPSLRNRALQNWLIETLVTFQPRTAIGGYAFDHTFLTYDGTSRYAQWAGWRRVMEELGRRVPDIAIDFENVETEYTDRIAARH